MATPEQGQHDPLLALRHATINNGAIVLTKSPDRADAEPSLALATHVFLGETATVFPLTSPTRFVSSDKLVDLRSILQVWAKNKDTIQDYVNSVNAVNDELAQSEVNTGHQIAQVTFVEKIALCSWLEGQTDDCEYIKPLVDEAASREAGAAARVAEGKAGGIEIVEGRRGKDERLAEIYKGERKMGDRNTVLRGIKPTDFSHIRKHAEVFLGRSRPRQGGPIPAPAPASIPTLVANRSKPSRRLEPIILLSSSPSSLVRTTNVRHFLESGVYVPSDSPLASGTDSGIIHISRLLPSINSHPTRFILVDNLDNFKPDYWARVVAVFTTGQTWQFKSYKWTEATELWRHALGVYVGFSGELVPQTVKNWGRGVKVASVDKWNPTTGDKGRWRDREVVEGIWSAIEESMRARGWGRDGPR